MTTTLRSAAATLAAIGLACLGCAGARFERLAKETQIERPPVLLVRDFAVTPEDLVRDVLGADYEPPASEDEDHAIARSLTEAIVARLREKGIEADAADASTAVPTNALLLQGQFVTVRQGSRLLRMAIGFGAGREEVQVQVQLYQWTGAELRRVSLAEARAHGDRKPGMAVPLAVGTVVTGGVLTPVLVAGSLNVKSEVVGHLRPTLDRLAEVIADDIAALYQERSWR